MKALVQAIFFIVLVAFGTTGMSAATDYSKHEQRNYFQFEIPKYETKRQGGQTLSVYVRFAYKKGLPEADYVDYRLMREEVLKFMEPTDEYPINVYWEILATAVGKSLMKHYPLDGVSVQFLVFDNQSQGIYEPGDHGPIYTIGDIAPLDVH